MFEFLVNVVEYFLSLILSQLFFSDMVSLSSRLRTQQHSANLLKLQWSVLSSPVTLCSHSSTHSSTTHTSGEKLLPEPFSLSKFTSQYSIPRFVRDRAPMLVFPQHDGAVVELPDYVATWWDHILITLSYAFCFLLVSCKIYVKLMNNSVFLCVVWVYVMSMQARFSLYAPHHVNMTSVSLDLILCVVLVWFEDLWGALFSFAFEFHMLSLIFKFRFPEDRNTYSIDRQFLWGRSLLITPVLEPGASSVTAYFPRGVWYDFYTVSCNGLLVDQREPEAFVINIYHLVTVNLVVALQ